MTDWRLEVDLKKLNDWLTTCHNMTGGGGVMTTSASTGVVYSAPRPPSWIWGDVKGKERRGKKTKGGKGRAGRGKGKGMEEKRERKWKGKWRERWYPTFWYKVTPMPASDIHTRRIGLATSNQSALFMISINRYYVKCLLYSVDSTASQQPASLQLQDIEDSNDSTFMDDVTSCSYNLNFVHPQGE